MADGLQLRFGQQQLELGQEARRIASEPGGAGDDRGGLQAVLRLVPTHRTYITRSRTLR